MPILNIAVLFIILGLAYFWSGQGLFSSLIHFVCVLVAGALAFAAWEPLTYAVLLGIRSDIAWMVGLLVPFIIMLGILRVLTNKFIPMNMDFANGVDFVGGGVFGVLSGVLTAGLLVISIGYLRVPPDFLGYRPVDWDRSTGAVDARNGSNLWVPADMIAAKIFEQLSSGSFSTGTPLAERLPNVHQQAGMLRTTYENRSRTTLKPEDVAVTGRYTVSADTPRELLADSFVVTADGTPMPQNVVFPDDTAPPAGSRIEGYVVRFNAGAKEKKGQTVIGPGQIRLIVDTPDGAMSVGPIAFVARASGSTLQVNRYRFDAPDVYAASVGGASESTFAFEFVVPPNGTPTDLLIKNIRAPVSAVPVTDEGISPAHRDELVQSGSIIGVQAESVGTATVISDDSSSGPTSVSAAESSSAIRETTGIGLTFNKQNRGLLELDSDNKIINGTATLDKSKLSGTSIPAVLQVKEFSVPAGTTMVHVNISPQSRMSLLGRSLDTAEQVLPPVLTDTLGQRYNAVGYIYEDTSKFEIRFTPGDPIRGLTQLPQLSRSRSDQKLTLLFTPSLKVQIVSFGLGPKTKVELNPPLELRRQR